MIDPCSEPVSGDGIISYGVTSYGYDVRIADEFRVFTPWPGAASEIDPKNMDLRCLRDFKGADYVVIPPNSFVLGRSVEYFRVPRDVLGICLGKSTYARCGLVVNVTPLEPEWEGYITIEISNTTPIPARVYANEGIMQVVFVQAAMRKGLWSGAAGVTSSWDQTLCCTSYADKNGKYQKQVGVVPARVL
jgi:dCTP deaminase